MKRLVFIIISGFITFSASGSKSLNAQTSPSPIYVIEWSHDGSKIAIGYGDGTVKIWEAASLELLFTLRSEPQMIRALAWSPDDTLLASGGYDNVVHIWDTAIGQSLQILDGHNDAIMAIEWNVDASKLMTQGLGAGGNPQNWQVWDTATWSFLEGQRNVPIVKIMPNLNYSQLAMVSLGGMVIIVDANTFNTRVTIEQAEIFSGEIGFVAAAWSPDGAYLATGSINGAVRVWDVASQQLILDLSGSDNQEIGPTTTSIRALAFNPIGETLAALSADGTLRTWDATTGQVLETIQLGSSPIYGAEWNPDKTTLAYGGEDGELHVVPSPVSLLVGLSENELAFR